MAHSPLDSPIYAKLFCDPVASDLMSEAHFIASMLKVEGHLAQVQGALRLIPKDSAAAIFEASSRVHIEPGELADGTAIDGIPVPSFVRLFRDKMGNPEHAQYVHWGATSQDIMDTALVLQMQGVFAHLAEQMLELLGAFAKAAATHRTLPMAARTRNQVATPTSFGARVALWGSPFLRHLERLFQAKARFEVVSFAGASGTLSALGDDGAKVADALAQSLGLAKQATPPHGARDNFAEISGVLALIAGSLGKFAGDLLLLGQSELREVRLGASGGSSTMPHKSNPVGPESVVTLTQVATANAGLMGAAMAHAAERDGAAWGVEWHALPQLVGATCGALKHGAALARDMEPEGARMMATIEATGGLMFAEAATFALAQTRPRPEAQDLVKRGCLEAVASGRHLREVLKDLADVDLGGVFEAERQLGAAPLFADRFVLGVAQAKKSFKF